MKINLKINNFYHYNSINFNYINYIIFNSYYTIMLLYLIYIKYPLFISHFMLSYIIILFTFIKYERAFSS